MLKARKGNSIILGLSDMNLTRLKMGQPIKFNLKELGLSDHDVFIFNGKDERTMKEMLKGNIGPDTKYSDTSNTPLN
jgi:hypothetical protein